MFSFRELYSELLWVQFSIVQTHMYKICDLSTEATLLLSSARSLRGAGLVLPTKLGVISRGDL